MNNKITFTTADEAVKVIKSGDHVHLSSVASAPQCLIQAMCRRGEAGELKDVHIHHLHTEGPAPYADPKFEGIFQLDSFFVGGNVRKVTQSGYADYIPIFLSETQKLYRSGVLPCNVAMIQVSPVDAHGYVSLGTSVDATLAAIECADYVLAVVNKYVPRAFGDAFIHISQIDYFIEDDQPLMEGHIAEITEIDAAIGRNCAELIEDGACLQMGIGAIPNAVLSQLGNHKDLGIHTEMFADGVLPLVEKGVVNGRNKVTDKGKIVSTFLMGSKEVYDFIDNNPGVLMKDVAYTNDPFIIAQNPKFCAINSALQIDLTGQVCADSLGTKFYSGVGGQVDFIYGSSLSKGGKAIIAMPSVTNKGISKIANTLALGAGVVTTRNHVHWVVTEWGAAYLYGKSLQERAKALINVVHPDHREELEKAAYERYGAHYTYIKNS
ncbi:MAG: acetyl-CoA hydrolase/transferase family protein [Tidjanibacter sp.]|nr:acetyl-CoA hydrolase/transferase family protein [Tidjanibacter sp.]